MDNTQKPKLYISQWYGFRNAKCPRCRRGNIFEGSAYSFKAQKMNELCPHCGLKFEREPGYFYVSMFVSYAMSVAQIITLSVASYVLGLKLDYENLWYFIGIILAGVLLLAPFNFRYSRVVLLYWLSPGLHYNPEKSADHISPDNRVTPPRV
ncbi:DUF983 domain-containing protein [Pedobacter yulinensis]|uniref:DUF983 domain-containing protein n=1 Tax=Pedobacter yulinensis TaxID=2126353 RepID=A0A2T3HIS3_9SPHI|nr:DUF983 domain-containing protein [Pedobacter yulinensis]PST82344.1 DUF983 domain-containing protein [Pedobacter yulinensis]